MAKKGKGKRKLSAYNKHIRKKVKAGATFMQAVRSWKGKKTKSRPKNKRKKYKQQRRNIVRSNMPRRRTRRRRSRGFGGFSVGRIGNTLKNIGLGFAIGAGTMAAINFVGDMANIPSKTNSTFSRCVFSIYSSTRITRYSCSYSISATKWRIGRINLGWPNGPGARCICLGG